MFIHNLNWVVTKCLPQVKFTFVEKNLGWENTWWNFTFKDVKFYEDCALWFEIKKRAYGNRDKMIYLHFQISQLKNADMQSFLLPFTFSITLLSLFDTCKLWYYLGIFDMDRIYVIRWAFIFPRLTKFQKKKKKFLSGCF